MTLLPFTIEAWDHGRGLQPCTADGREVKQLTLFQNCDAPCPLIGVVGGAIRMWRDDGVTHGFRLEACDLRLRPKTEKRWIQVVRNLSGVERSFVSTLEPAGQCDEIARVEIEVPVP